METASKTCFKCQQTKPLADFYRHPQMADGHLNKCKACTKADVARRYVEARPKILAYEQDRARRPERKAKVLDYQRTRRNRYPEKDKARRAVANALRDGRLTREPCDICGTTENVQAHHHDYSRPLDVRRLCFKHHREVEHGQTVGLN